MIGKCTKVSDPVRVHRPTGLHSCTNPGSKESLTFFRARVNGVVHEHEAYASLGKPISFLPTMTNDLGAIGVNDNGIHFIEDGLIFRPTIDDGSMNIEATLFVEGFGEELAASVEFMLT